MTQKLNGQTITQQLIENHPDLFIQEFIQQSLNNNPNVINKNNINYFSKNITMFNIFKQDVNELLRETIENYLISIGLKKDKDYSYAANYTIKTNPIVLVKLLTAYNYNSDLANILKNVLVY